MTRCCSSSAARRCSTTATRSGGSKRARGSSASASTCAIVGTVSPAELERHYRAADLFAFPSTKEGFGLVALEALAAGLPVVASEIDVFLTFLVHGESALLSPPGDGSALGRSLARLAADPQLCERLVAAGRHVVDAYGWDIAAAAHENAYHAFRGERIGVG